MPKIYSQNSWDDEALVGSPTTYEIEQSAGGAITNVNQLNNVQITLNNTVATHGTEVTSALMTNIEEGIDNLDTKVALISDVITTGGSSTAFTATTPASATALATWERFTVKFHATAGVAPTLNRDGKGAKALKFYNAAGVKTACGAKHLLINTISDIVYDGTDYIVLDLLSHDIHSASNKVTIDDADEFGIADSASGLYGFAHITWSLIKSTLLTAFKDVSGGLAGLTLFKINFRNTANTATSFLINANTAARDYTYVNRNAEIGNEINNVSVAAQSPAASTRTYLTGSAIAVPTDKLRIGTILEWYIDITKTAAGANTWVIDVCFGTNGTTADTARISFTVPAGTAAVDHGLIKVKVIIRGPLSNAGVAVGHIEVTKASAVAAGLFATGNLASFNDVVVSAGFDVTVANLIVGVCITPGAGAAYTHEMVISKSKNL